MNLFSSLTALAATFPAAAVVSPESADIFSSPLAKSAVVFLFFSLAALFLRFLYGPNGKLRGKDWDKLNEEFAKAEEEKKRARQSAARLTTQLAALQKELEPVLQKEGRAFRAYVEPFYSGDPQKDELFRLKDEHSHGVFRNAWSLIQGEAELREPFVARAALLAALYHDIGRFEQLRAYHSFNDRESVNHATLGAKLLSDRRFMADATPETRRTVRAAVALHGAPALPERLTRNPGTPLALAARALRDADKLDIMRVMQEGLKPGTTGDPAVSFNLPDEPEKYSPAIAEAVLQGRAVLTADLRWRNDFRLYVCSWANLLEFTTSRRLLSRSGHLDTILSWLPDDAVMNELRGAVKSRLA